MPAPRIARSVPKPKKQPRYGDDRRHLEHVRACGCAICGKRAEAHHLLRIGEQLPKGTGRKQLDKWAIPLCPGHHNRGRDSAHGHGNDEVWLASKGIDGRALARALWKNRGDLEAMRRVVFRANQTVNL